MERYTSAYYWMNEATEAFDKMLEKGIDTTKKEASADIEALKAAARKRARKG